MTRINLLFIKITTKNTYMGCIYNNKGFNEVELIGEVIMTELGNNVLYCGNQGWLICEPGDSWTGGLVG